MFLIKRRWDYDLAPFIVYGKTSWCHFLQCSQHVFLAHRFLLSWKPYHNSHFIRTVAKQAIIIAIFLLSTWAQEGSKSKFHL